MDATPFESARQCARTHWAHFRKHGCVVGGGGALMCRHIEEQSRVRLQTEGRVAEESDWETGSGASSAA